MSEFVFCCHENALYFLETKHFSCNYSEDKLSYWFMLSAKFTSAERAQKEVRDSEIQYSSVIDFLLLFLPAFFSLVKRKTVKSCKTRVITPKLLIVQLIKKESEFESP